MQQYVKGMQRSWDVFLLCLGQLSWTVFRQILRSYFIFPIQYDYTGDNGDGDDDDRDDDVIMMMALSRDSPA